MEVEQLQRNVHMIHMHALLSFPLWLQSPLSLLTFAENGSLNSPYEGGIYKHNPFNFQWA